MNQTAKSELILGDCYNEMFWLADNSINLTVTSPPYDDLRGYANLPFEKFQKIARELFRITAPGGVVVWVVGDAVVKGSETGTSFRQALAFKELGFLLHDTMIYAKNCFAFPMNTRYHQQFEYMFVLSKGKPRTFNPIKDRKNKHAGQSLHVYERQKDGSIKKGSDSDFAKTLKDFGMRHNIWEYNVGRGHMAETIDAHQHPAIFPLKLAKDHVLSWSNPRDIVFDPFLGSGTVGVACKILDRSFIGIEQDSKYFAIAKKRIDNV